MAAPSISFEFATGHPDPARVAACCVRKNVGIILATGAQPFLPVRVAVIGNHLPDSVELPPSRPICAMRSLPSTELPNYRDSSQ